MNVRLLILGLWVAAPAPADEAPWSTYRGNVRRTGNTDNVAPPAKPEVLWLMQSKENYVASSVPSGDQMVFVGLGGFNEGAVHSLPAVPTDPKAVKPVWSKGGQFLRHPTFSSPAVAGDKLVFGAGMHLSDGAALFCLPADGGHLLWVVDRKGHLIHMEASPTVSD